MALKLPKRLLRAGCEPRVTQINNNCRMPLLDTVADYLPKEVTKVKEDPVFRPILAIHNSLSYSARLVHSFLSRQLVTDKEYELWFVFGKRPLRFSLQEFYAVTGLKYESDDDSDFDKWVDDGGFWSNLLKEKRNISLKVIQTKLLPVAHKWKRVDRLRLVYLVVIAGIIMAKGEKTNIPIEYIKVVMDIEKVHSYPWGAKAYSLLLESFFNARDKFFKQNNSKPKTSSYVLDGFSYAFQIWIMEAIPIIGNLLGNKRDPEFTNGPRCVNWKGSAKVSYEDIIHIENTFGKEVSITCT